MKRMKSSLKLLTVFFIMVIVATGFAAVAFADSTTIYVPDDYAKIQWAVNNASSGDIIIIRDGIYTENVNVIKSLTIRSENGSGNCTVKAADPLYHTFQVIANRVNIHGLTVKGATAYARPWPAGIHLQEAEYCNISNNKVLYNHDGIELDFASNNIIKNNTVHMNRENGIELDPGSNNNLIKNNNVSKSRCELFLYRSSNNTLINNTISGHHGSFGVWGDELSHYIHNIDTSNKVNGKPIYYWVSKQNQQMPSDAGYVGVVNSTNITVRDLTLTNNSQGVLLAYSTNSRIENINASYNLCGILLYNSSNNNLTSNNVSNNLLGTILRYSGNNNLTNNKISRNNFGFGVRGGSLSHYIHNIDTSNKVNGKPIYYWVGKQNQQMPSDAGYVGVVNSTNITVRDLTLTNNSQGVLLAYSTNSRIENINASYNLCGISLHNSSNNNLTNNKILNDYEKEGTFLYKGIRLRHSSNNILTNNIANLNDWGIYLSYSSNNFIYLNNFINNYDNVFSSNSTNTWNSTEKITYIHNETRNTNCLGNYWSDYNGSDADGDGIGDIPYIIDSDKDNYPLMEPWEDYIVIKRPIVSISIDKYEYTTCEMMNVTIGLKNPTDKVQKVVFAGGINLTDCDSFFWIKAKTITLPSHFDYLYTIPLHVGNWSLTEFNASWYVVLTNTTTQEVISEDTVDWRYEPSAIAKGGVGPEKIVEELMDKNRGMEPI